MKRIAEKKIDEWMLSKRRKPLIIRGGRQVGKTWLVENYLSGKFENFIKIDFERQQNLHVHFESNLDPVNIVEAIELSCGRIIPGRTLLFFDEIQACPRAITALRYFYEQMPELHVIAAGSLLEFAFSEISVPVGRIQFLQLNPMTFYEYLLALDKQPMAEQTLKPASCLTEAMQQMILQELKKYFFTGGMPECVKVYCESRSFLETFRVQSEIIDSFRYDFSKYRPQVDTSCLDAVFMHTARAIGEQIKYTRLNDNHSGPTNRKAFELLLKARLLHKIPNCDPSGLPLGASASEKKFKACFLDIGLLQRLCQVSADQEIKQDNLLAIYQGKLAEQFVAQELTAWHNSDIFYWSREAKNSNAEVDFLVVRDQQIYPVEVKSGTGGSLKSLHMILEKYPHCPQGLVLYSGPYRQINKQKLTFLPLYCASTIGDRQDI